MRAPILDGVPAAPAEILPAEIVPEEDFVDIGTGCLLAHQQTAKRRQDRLRLGVQL